MARCRIRRTGRGALLVIAVAILTACSTRGPTIVDPMPEAMPSSETPPAPSPADSAASSAGGTVITVGGSDYGPMLFDRRGQAIYLFDKETTSRPACYGDCAAAWPPVLTTGSPQATGGSNATLIGVTPREDGSLQVTYAGHPLYFYAREKPGEVLCHDVREFGGTWLVVTPGGAAAPG